MIRSAVRCAVFAAAVALAPAAARAQTPADSAAKLLDAAATAYQQGTREGLTQALRLFLESATLYRRAGMTAEAADAESSVAALHNALGRPDSALAYYERAVPDLKDPEILAYVLTQYGEVFHGMGQLDSALARYRPALEFSRQVANRSDEATTLNNIGAAFNTLGRPDSAWAYLHASLAIRRELGEALGEGVTLNNLAVMHQGIGRPDSALEYLQQSLAARRRAQDAGGEGTTLNNIGFSFELMEVPDSAVHYYRVALEVLDRAGRRSTYGVALGNLGRVFLTLSQPDSARKYLTDGMAVKQEVDDLRGTAWMLNDLGRMHAAAGREDSASSYFARALRALRDVGERAREGNTLFNIGRFHHRARDRPDLSIAVAYYDSAAALRALVGARTTGDADRVAFVEQDVHLFAEWSLAWLARASELGAERAAAAALAAAERGRAQALLDLMRTSASTGAEVPGPGADLVAEGERLAAGAAAAGNATLQYLVGEDTLVVWLIDGRGRVAATQLPIGRDSLALLVAAWREGFSDADRARSLEAVAPSGIGIRRGGTIDPETAATLLRDALLPAALRDRLPPGGELLIIPHGALALLPYAALPAESGAELLGGRYAIRYAPSLATLLEAESAGRADARAAPGQDALIVGNPIMPRVPVTLTEFTQPAPLPGAAREAAWIAERLRTEPLVGAAATEAAVLARIGGARIVHLATHGFAYSSDARARDSFVALAPGQGHDGLLTVAGILEDVPALSAQLIVLSACQTGLGDLKHAEGTVGLQRAFLARGASSVLVSLWSVSDDATEALMKAFYRHWLDDDDRPGKAEALRRAQADVRATAGFEHPRYWAAFQLVGGR